MDYTTFKKPPHSRCNFVDNDIIVGARPIPETIDDIINTVTMIVNLENQADGLWYESKLPDSIKYYHLPCASGKPPDKKKASVLAATVLEHLLKKDTIVYVHCNGGHGRSATFAGLLIGIRYNLDISRIVFYLEQTRQTRPDKSRNFIPTPETQSQINFLKDYFGLDSNEDSPDRSDTTWLKKVKKQRMSKK